MNKTKRLLISMLTLLFCCMGMWAEGELNGEFTISASGGKVKFSQGNLQYQASTNTWRFATNQYDYIGNAAGNTSPSSTQTEWIDYFNWGTSGYDHGAICYQPWSTSKTQSDYYAYGSSSKNLYDAKDDNSMRGKADWGYNAISNGGNTENSGWRILTKDEWAYLINTRSETYRYAKGTIHGKNGLMLFPDGFTLPTGVSISNANTTDASYTSYSDGDWTALEAAGVVFLPATGLRNGTSVEETGTIGNYWSSTCMNADRVYNIRFDSSSLKLENDGDRQNGFPVRLVKSNLKQDGEGNYLIGSVQDWNDFATIVNNGINRTANAKMTADINLGTDKTMAGTSSSNYQGVFDGQGHTITINFVVTENYLGLFRYISGATIKNLHVTGTISTNDYGYAGGIVGVASGTSTIQNCQSSVNIQSTIVGDGVLGGIVACSAPENSGATLNINDCLFNGSMNGPSTMTCGGFVAWRYDGNTVNISNSIFLPTSATVSTTYSACFVGHGATSLTNCYHKTVIGTVQGAEATAENLANGTTTAALNNGRTGADAPWVQEGSQPMLKLFALQQDGDNYYLLGNVAQWKQFAKIVETTPTANAKMTADIDLGTDQTMMGSIEHPYSGTFDGQGFTLTVHLNSTIDGVAPFRRIDNTTIKNLAVAGSITGGIHSAGLVGGMPENSTFNLINNVMVSATITTTDTHCGGILGHGGSTENTTIQDCLFNGTINGKVGGSTVGVIWGWQTYGHANIISCLENGTYTNCSSFNPLFQTASGPVNSYSNNYYVNGSSTYGTKATATTLGNGTVTTGLNAGRVNGPWVQDAVSGEPRLDLFMATTSLTANEGKTGEYWSTYYDGAKSSIADANTTVYTGKVNGDKIDLTEIVDKTIPAGNAVILKSTAANVTLTKTSATGTLANNDLKGVDVATAKTDVYCLNKNGTVVGFYAFTGTIPAHRGYLVITSGAPQYLGFDDNGGTTGVNEMRNQTEKVRGEFFDLQGRRILNPTKGLYIVNGRKVIIK